MQSLEINLGANREGKLNEALLAHFGSLTKMLLRRMFGFDLSIPVNLVGNKSEIDSFGRALSSEKRYMDSYMRNGLNSPETFRTKAELSGAVRKFERTTGLKWPFK